MGSMIEESEMDSEYTIDLERVKQDLYELGRFGYNPEDQGIYRQGFSDEDMKARYWLLEKMRALDLDAWMDGAGNVCGRYGGKDKKTLLIASHLDSVPAGGLFDGTLGVMAGLEVIRVIQENNIPIKHAFFLTGADHFDGMPDGA